MNNLQTLNCNCGEHTFTVKDIKPPLMRVPKNFYGGNVDRLCNADCPGCGKPYTLWIKQTGQTWRVVTMSRNGWDEDEQDPLEDEFDGMDKPALHEWLYEHNVEYVKQWGEKRLREAARNATQKQDND